MVTSVALHCLDCGNQWVCTQAQPTLFPLVSCRSLKGKTLAYWGLVASSYVAGVGILEEYADWNMTYLNCCEIGDACVHHLVKHPTHKAVLNTKLFPRSLPYSLPAQMFPVYSIVKYIEFVTLFTDLIGATVTLVEHVSGRSYKSCSLSWKPR